MTGVGIRHYDHHQAAEPRLLLLLLLLEAYGEVYADSADALDDVDRFAEGLDSWISRPG
ncbi:hypothetical protein [Streptomyces sp. NPDC004296]|uniref:hypothetical protein n=1 Tax=Streptomyces sp. NPDC004296 TaxID=3364697 RepID=UPI0036AA22C2